MGLNKHQDLSVRIVDVAEGVAESPVEFNLVVARTNGFGTAISILSTTPLVLTSVLRPARLTACSSRTEVMERIRFISRPRPMARMVVALSSLKGCLA